MHRLLDLLPVAVFLNDFLLNSSKPFFCSALIIPVPTAYFEDRPES
jgi:hypothetical protein